MEDEVGKTCSMLVRGDCTQNFCWEARKEDVARKTSLQIEVNVKMERKVWR
jgi:hypothetical protein